MDLFAQLRVLKNYIKAHIKKFGLLLGLGTFYMGAWQLDLLLSPLIDWTYTKHRELWGLGPIHIIVANATMYNLCWLAIFIGVHLTIAALWFWD